MREISYPRLAVCFVLFLCCHFFTLYIPWYLNAFVTTAALYKVAELKVVFKPRDLPGL